MRTVPFQSVLHAVATRIGLDPEVNLQANQAAALCVHINDRVREAWDWYDWPEVTTIEFRRFRPTWDALVAYAADDEVYYATDDRYYRAIATTVAGDLPTDATKWEEITSLDRYVAYEQSGQTEIDGCFRAWDADPRVSESALEIDHASSENGIQFGPDCDVTGVWIEIRRRSPAFTATPYAAATTYAAGALVYYATTGECYEAKTSTTGAAPTDTSKWTKIDFPYRISAAVARGAYADALREDGQEDKAAAEEQRFETALVRERDKLELAEGDGAAWGAKVYHA